MQEIWVGCCGFPVSRQKYYQSFKVVELQNTFYDLPSHTWAERIAKEVPEGFRITMKAWQVITHPPRSPTWKRVKTEIIGDKENYGLLKPTKENFWAWEKTIEIAETLKARVIVLQTPPSLPFTQESIAWIRRFFKDAVSIAPRSIYIGWEPRGEWSGEKAFMHLRNMFTEYGIIHIVDILKKKPIMVDKRIMYTRLHGLGRGYVNYKYKYTDEDLSRLIDAIREIGAVVNYVMFNNIYMFDDANRLREMAKAVFKDVY